MRINPLVVVVTLSVLLGVCIFGFVRDYRRMTTPPAVVAIEFPERIEVTGQDVEQLQRAVSAMIAYRVRPGRKLYISGWRQDDGTFRMTVRAKEVP